MVNAEKVANWITDWESSKPAGIEGKLVILMIGTINVGDGNYSYIKEDGENVLVYEMGDLCNTYYPRNDGVSTIAKAVNEGANIDGMMMQMGIDPTKDMLLFVQGNGTNEGKNMAGAARMWYTFSYWGVEKEHKALLNGNASYVLNPEANTNLTVTKADLYGASASTPPMNGSTPIASIRRDATVLQATMKEMMHLIDTDDSSALILDTRSSDEYAGTKRAKTELKTCGVNQDEQCYTAFDGHIKGAKHLYYTDILETSEAVDLDGDGNVTDVVESSYRFKSMEEITQIFADVGYEEGKTLYTYCRTGTKASLLTFGASQVVGYPTRMYDGSWIQWGKMAHRVDANGSTVIPEESAWRTDIDQYSEAITYNGEDTTVHPTDPATLHLDATDTNAIIEEDIHYKAQ